MAREDKNKAKITNPTYKNGFWWVNGKKFTSDVSAYKYIEKELKNAK